MIFVKERAARRIGDTLRKGMRLMKSFGLRLGMGAITVVLAAYIAIVSRNGDTENVSEWTAESTLDQAPASPLGTALDSNSLDSGWLQPPEVDLAEGTSLFPPNSEQPNARSLAADNALIPSAPPARSPQVRSAWFSMMRKPKMAASLQPSLPNQLRVYQGRRIAQVV